MSELETPSYAVKPEQFRASYSLIDIEKIRKQLVEELYESPSRTVVEIQSKRKCGVLAKDVIEFYTSSKKSPDFVNFSSAEQCQSYYEEQMLEMEMSVEVEADDKLDASQNNGLKIDDEAMSPNDHSELEEEKPSNSQIKSPVFSDEDLLKKFIEPKMIMQDASEPSEASEVELMCKELNKSHACEKKFCPRNLCSVHEAEEARENTQCTVVFACDYCQLVLSLREKMVNHLIEYSHFSASEYIVERMESQDECSKSSQSKIKYVKSRSSLKNFNADNSFAVFCPKCSFCFATGVLASGMHYKYVHNNQAEFVYSVAERKRSEEFEIDKSHTCFTCNQKFKKLTDLVTHLENTKHFPQARPNELNVFNCPFDNCKFISISFFSFKTHILSHTFFNRPQSEQFSDMRVLIKVNVYPVPNSFFHIAKFSPEDKQEELNAIDCLLDSLKGHNDYNELSKKLRARKDQLHKNSDV